MEEKPFYAYPYWVTMESEPEYRCTLGYYDIYKIVYHGFWNLNKYREVIHSPEYVSHIYYAICLDGEEVIRVPEWRMPAMRERIEDGEVL